MPESKGIMYTNLLDLLYQTINDTPQTVYGLLKSPDPFEMFSKEKKSATPTYAEFISTINHDLLFGNKKMTALKFVIEKNMLNRVQMLFDLGANHDLPNYDYFTEIVKKNASLELIKYCIDNNKICPDKKFNALTASYNKNLTDYLEKFETIHRFCFRLSFSDILRGIPMHGMERGIYDAHVSGHRNNLIQNKPLLKSLKEIYLNVITLNSNYKSSLKIHLALENENPIITLIQLDPQRAEPTETSHFSALKNILKGHILTATDLSTIRIALDESPTPNPTLAALYFAYYTFSNKSDFELFIRHLVNITQDDHAPASQKRLSNLLNFYLSDHELQKLKENIGYAAKNEEVSRAASTITWNENLVPPTFAIACTGLKTRSINSTNTFKVLFDCGWVKQDSAGYKQFYQQTLPLFGVFKKPKTPPPTEIKADAAYDQSYIATTPSAPPY